MTASFLIHPLSTFLAGVLITCGVLACSFALTPLDNGTERWLADYQQQLANTPAVYWAPDSAEEKAAVGRFKAFLKGIGEAGYVSENTSKVYASNAYLDDTLVTHRGADEIERYFLKTAATMTGFLVSIDDVSRSGGDYYVRWRMVFAAPALNRGKAVHSVGISQIRFNPEGKVSFHQDFWDSGRNFYGQLPVVGGLIGWIRKRLG